jgi:hypothetical protein
VEAQMEHHYLVENEGKLKWCDHGTCFVLEDDDNLHEHLKVLYSILVTLRSYFVVVKNSLTVPTCELEKNPEHLEFLNVPIVKYAQTKTIFSPRLFYKDQLYQPHLLIKAINFIANNEGECAEYWGLQPWERRTQLKTWVRRQIG